jgi:hypothetical protein
LADAVAKVGPILAFAIAGVFTRYGVYIFSNGPSSFNAYLDALCVWDCAWYRTIVEGGYDLTPGVRLRPGAANWAFFPLYPMGVAALHNGLHLPTVVAGCLLSNLYAMAATLAARPLFDGNRRAYWLFAFAMFLGPFAMLFSTLYTESLFVLLIILSLLALRTQRYVLAGLAAALLSATRVTGVLMTIAILVSAIVDSRRAGVRWRDIPLRLIGNPNLLLGLFLAPLGLFIYIVYLHHLVGDGFAFAHIQRAWHRSLGNPLQVLWDAFQPSGGLSPAWMVTATWGSGAIVSLGLSLILALRRRYAAATFTTLAIAASLCSGITSMIRFSAGLAPLGMTLSELLASRRILYWLAFPAAFAIGIATTIGWFRSSLFVM